ncbi:hypothetical protein LOC100646682 [Anopheles sinensis]|uniref:Uncharacterized protein n=1 Tax=Anopheles sinensis TaxID=74873 RepID=A0A084VA11_ANOSI|nr:hypothetical protein LOC100646682 [Anopheles sinensis]
MLKLGVCRRLKVLPGLSGAVLIGGVCNLCNSSSAQEGKAEKKEAPPTRRGLAKGGKCLRSISVIVAQVESRFEVSFAGKRPNSGPVSERCPPATEREFPRPICVWEEKWVTRQRSEWRRSPAE